MTGSLLLSSNDSIVFGLQNSIFHTMPFIYISMTTYVAYHKRQLSDKKCSRSTQLHFLVSAGAFLLLCFRIYICTVIAMLEPQASLCLWIRILC